MRDIHLEFVRVTEAAAIAASRWIGSGDKISADKDATEAMRDRLNQLPFSGVIAIGEGEKDKSYGLFAGERVGKLSREKGSQNVYELAIDPIDGTRPTVTSGPEAMSVLAVADAQALFSTDAFYMNKLAYGPDIARKADLRLTDPLAKTVEKIAQATRKDVHKIMACLLDRPRHEKIVAELRRLGVRIKLIQDCDISGAIAACMPESGIDFQIGIGGSPEGVITACAMKCLRGGFQAQLAKSDGTILDDRVYGAEELVKGHCVFTATGVTDGSLLKGVRFSARGAVTHSVFMRSESGTIRWLEVQHGN